MNTKLKRALDLMRTGSVLIRENGGDHQYYLAPGGHIEAVTALAILSHPQVVGGHDGMWPGYDQTWKLT